MVEIQPVEICREICIEEALFIPPLILLCTLCEGVKGPTLCKINFTALHDTPLSPSSELECEKVKLYIYCLLHFSKLAWPKCAVLN